MRKEFKAIIQQHEGLNAGYVEPPFDVQEVFGAKRVKVRATFDGVEYQGSVVSMGGCYMLGMTREIREKIGKDFGEEVFVTLEKDEEERKVQLPEDFGSALHADERAMATYDSFPFTAQKEYVTWITSAKREETRKDSVRKAVLLLYEGRRLRS
ncbi:MAG TPA: YdeI/OmpD-associated family protein [Clostridiaceae bacterium]|nr:YdeI/OmpD-associated family protein [Clostridiaceae bacterium]